MSLFIIGFFFKIPLWLLQFLGHHHWPLWKGTDSPFYSVETDDTGIGSSPCTNSVRGTVPTGKLSVLNLKEFFSSEDSFYVVICHIPHHCKMWTLLVSVNIYDASVILGGSPFPCQVWWVQIVAPWMRTNHTKSLVFTEYSFNPYNPTTRLHFCTLPHSLVHTPSVASPSGTFFPPSPEVMLHKVT